MMLFSFRQPAIALNDMCVFIRCFTIMANKLCVLLCSLVHT